MVPARRVSSHLSKMKRALSDANPSFKGVKQQVQGRIQGWGAEVLSVTSTPASRESSNRYRVAYKGGALRFSQ